MRNLDPLSYAELDELDTLLLSDAVPLGERYNLRMNKPAPAPRHPAIFAVASLAEADDDKAYWRSKSAHERLHAIEQMRQVIYGYQPASSRLQRIFEVAELTAG